MKKTDISELCRMDYSVHVKNVIRQYWQTYSSYTCIGMPKPLNILTYIDSTEAVYEAKNGEHIHAVSGDIVYTPIESEYTVNICNSTDKINTVSIYFHLSDTDGMPFKLSDSPLLFRNTDKSLMLLFSKAVMYCARQNPDLGRIKAGLYDILSELSSKRRYEERGEFSLISKGILCIEQDSWDLQMKDIAEMCSMSESHFRKLFKKYSGMSPTEYRTERKIERARQYLELHDMPISEIAAVLGFGTTAYFIKVFHDKTGETPLKYRDRIRKENPR